MRVSSGDRQWDLVFVDHDPEPEPLDHGAEVDLAASSPSIGPVVPRWLVLLLFAFVGLTPLAHAAAVLGEGWHPTGDDAIIALRAQDVGRGNLPLVGQPTTADALKPGTPPSNHPGPLEYYLLAAPVALFGTRVGVMIGSASIVSASFVASLWLARRRGGPVLVGLVAVGLLLVARATGNTTLHDPWNADIAMFPMVLAVLTIWSMLDDDLGVAWVGVVAISLAAQVHAAAAVALLPLAGLLGVVLLVAGVRAIRTWVDVGGRLPLPLMASFGLGVLIWLPAVIHEFGPGPSNLRLLAGAGSAGVGVLTAMRWFPTAVAPVPLFVEARSDEFLRRPTTLSILGGYFLVGLAGTLGLVSRFLRRDSAHLLWVAVVAFAAGCLLVAADTPPSMLLRPDLFRWMWVMSLVCWLALAWSLWNLLPLARLVRTPTALVLACGLLVAALSITAVATADVAHERDGRLTTEIGRLADQIRAQNAPGRYLLRVSDGPSYTVAPALMAELGTRGVTALIDVGPFGNAYHRSRKWHGERVRALLRLTMTPDPGARVIGSVSSGSSLIVVEQSRFP